MLRESGEFAIFGWAEIVHQLFLVLAGDQKPFHLGIAQREPIVWRDVIERRVGAAHCAVRGRTIAATCILLPSASSNTSGTVAPTAGGRVIPCSITCSPPGSSLTVCPPGTTSCS